MKSNMSIRTTLLTFSFTSVITTIGFGISKYDIAPFWIYILSMVCCMVYYLKLDIINFNIINICIKNKK